MGRFPWTSGHTKPGTDHKYVLPQEWFSKSNVEPSRQALDELIKEHQCSTSDGTCSVSTRSRSNTASSIRSYQTQLTSESVYYSHSRPVSRHNVTDGEVEAVSHPEAFSRSSSLKGSLLRRHGSKLNLLPSQVDESKHGRMYPASATHSASTSRSSTTGFNHSPKRPEIARNISAPFIPKHGTGSNESRSHQLPVITDFNQLPTRDTVPTEMLIATGGLIEPSSSSNISKGAHTSRSKSPTYLIKESLPVTPPKPQPPPKDSQKPINVSTDVRLSRSMENFSRPTRSPVTSFDASHTASGAFRTPLRSPISTAPPSPYGPPDSMQDFISSRASSRRSSIVQTVVQVKPLPLLPTIVHAVSTVDDTAIPMRSAPLPMPLPEVPEEDEASLSNDNQSSGQRQSLRHVQTFPSSKASKRRSKSASDIKFDHVNNTVTFSEQESNTSPTQKKRISIGLKTIPTDNWEAAIDYSWDLLEELDDDLEAVSESNGPRTPPELLPHETHLTILQPHIYQGSSSSSSPLTMHTSSNKSQLEESNQMTKNEHDLQQYSSGPPVLQGLGIESFRPLLDIDYNDLIRQAETKIQTPAERDSVITAFRRERDNSIGKSSSKESVILSIASSILDTHRSSHSSTSLNDFAHLANFEDKLVKSISSDTVESPIGNSSDTSQDTIKTSTKFNTAATVDFAPPASESFHSSPSSRHERFASASVLPLRQNTIPSSSYINSSGNITPLPVTGRQRSSTTNIRSKYNTRGSYSLFPTVQTVNPDVLKPIMNPQSW